MIQIHNFLVLSCTQIFGSYRLLLEEELFIVLDTSDLQIVIIFVFLIIHDPCRFRRYRCRHHRQRFSNRDRFRSALETNSRCVVSSAAAEENPKPLSMGGVTIIISYDIGKDAALKRGRRHHKSRY